MNAEHATHDQSAGEHVDNPARILTLLTRIQREGRFVTVALPGAPRSYGATLLAVEARAGRLLLDALSPPEGEERLAAAGFVDIYARLADANLHFRTTLEATTQEDNTVVHRLPFPAAIDYAQRRAHYRVKVALGQAVPLVLPVHEATSPVEGQLRDLSLGGVGALVNGESGLAPGEVVEECVLRLPRVGELVCDLEVRYLADDSGQGKRLGGRFVDLPPRQRRQIERVIAELERELLRKRPRR